MNIRIDEENFLPYCRSQVSLTLEKNKLNLIRGVNGIGKSSFAAWVKKRYVHETTLIEQSPLIHFYNRHLIELKDIYINAKPHCFDQDILTRLWKVFDLDQVQDHYLHQLSGGENQSLKLALGLSIKKELIIIDEPSQYLDMNRKAELSKFLGELMQENYLLIIEHDSSWLNELPQKVAEFYMEERKLKARYV